MKKDVELWEMFIKHVRNIGRKLLFIGCFESNILIAIKENWQLKE